MNDFYFYKYQFTQVPAEPLLGQEDYDDEPEVMLNRRLEEKLLPVMHKRDNGTVENYSNVLFYHDGVGLMRLQNTKEITLYRKDFSVDKDETFPYVDIIIDNREGHHLMAIERNGSFNKTKGDDNSTQRIAKLLEESISDYLRRYGWAVNIKAFAKQHEMWPTVITRIRDCNARVRSIEFKFPTDDDTHDAQEFDALMILTQLSRHNGASDASFRLNYKNGDEAEIANAENDFRAMEMFARRQHYELNVTFNDMSIVRSGAKLYAHYEILVRDISDFINNTPGFGADGTGQFLLNSFLDDINETLNDYEDQ